MGEEAVKYPFHESNVDNYRDNSTEENLRSIHLDAYRQRKARPSARYFTMGKKKNNFHIIVSLRDY